MIDPMPLIEKISDDLQPTIPHLSHSDLEACHEVLIESLRGQNILDLTTIPSEVEKETLMIQFQKMAPVIIAKNVSDQRLHSLFIDRLALELFGAGPLEALLNGEGITEITVNGPTSIWFEKEGRMQKWPDRFLTDISYNNFVMRMTTECRVNANLDRPFADGHWRSHRLHLIIPPVTQKYPVISLRRHPDNPWTLRRLQNQGWASENNADFIRQLIREKRSFLIIGSTGTGKTSLLNACLQEVPEQERIVTIEDTSELHLPNDLSIKLLSRVDPQKSLQDVEQMELVRQVLRMRPDRIIMGEVRGAEAKDLLMALSTGHNGGMGTMHADSARQSLFRLEMLIQLGAPQWSLHAIRHLIFFGIQYIIEVEKTEKGRVLSGISRLASIEETGICLERIF